MVFSISEFARRSGMGPHTLRYYEKEGLLSPARDRKGRRIYSESDLAWAAFILRLKETGMPIGRIREYARLREQGRATLMQRKTMLECHRDRIREALRQWQAHLAKLEQKIKIYQAEINGCDDRCLHSETERTETSGLQAATPKR